MQESTRRGFWAALWAVIVGFLFGASSINAATKINLDQIKPGIPGTGLIGYAANAVTPVTVGSGLSLSGGVLSAPPAPPPVIPVRTFGVLLARDISGGYPLPVGVRSKTAVWRGGMRQAAGVDYNIAADVVTPVAGLPWEEDATVLVDGE